MTMLVVPGDMQLSNDKAERAAKPLPAYLAKIPRLKLEMLPRFLRKLFVVDGEVDDVAADLEDAAADEENRGEQRAAESTDDTANNASSAKCDRQKKYAVVRLFSTCITCRAHEMRL